ncbi:MAG: hypothetical protein AB7O68_16615 [Pirellulales bacterium]
MRFLPPRRWFQFRLSTWFVLLAILGWGMTCRPYCTDLLSVVAEHELLLGYNDDDPYHTAELATLDAETGINPALRWPALALAVFLAWKAAWAVVPRVIRRRQSAAPE